VAHATTSTGPGRPFDLAEHGGDREHGEVHATRRVVTVDCLDQPDDGDLEQVVSRFTPARVAASEVLRQRQPRIDHPFRNLGRSGSVGSLPAKDSARALAADPATQPEDRQDRQAGGLAHRGC
jgi:hypothetical protein